MIIEYTRQPLADALRRARAFCKEPHDPPLTRQEIYSIYRQARGPSGNIFLRCTPDEDEAIRRAFELRGLPSSLWPG